MEEPIELEIGEEQRLGVYANEIGMMIGEPDITIDFLKAVPGALTEAEPKRLLVARVTLSWPTVDLLAKRLKSAREDLESAKRESKGKTTRAKASEGG